MGAKDESQTVSAGISFVAAVQDGEKAYHMMYRDVGGFPRTNISHESHTTRISDVRGHEASLDFAKNGIAIRELRSKMSYTDFESDERIRQVYFTELQDHLQASLCASEVRVFRYGIRRRHASYPVSTGAGYDFEQPTSFAHVDATIYPTQEELAKQFGDRAETLMSRRYQWVNVWKPLRGPVNDWPLCFCDASSVDPSDAVATDMVYPQYFTENLSMRFNERQKWFYLSDHRPDEIIIFKQSDSDQSAVGGVPHCSFDNPLADPEEPPRESIEARALVIY